MKIFNIITVVIWVCVASSVYPMTTASIQEARNSIPNSTQLDTGKNLPKKRSRRFIYTYFPWAPYNTCIALAVVLAIPLQLKGRNVYMSYNFETNFYMPYFDVTQGLVPLPWATIDAPAVNTGTVSFYANGGQTRKLNSGSGADGGEQTDISELSVNGTKSATGKSNISEAVSSKHSKTSGGGDASKKRRKPKQPKKKSKSAPHKPRVNREILSTLLSRKKLYKMLEHKLDMAGLNGEECLLKAICETAEQPFAEHNGVLGDIVHIIFTPTSSRDENLPKRYYEAITDGESGRCRYYNTLCPKGIFDIITKTFFK